MTSFHKLIALTGFSILVGLSTITSGDASPTTQPAPGNIPQLINQLGSDSSKDRDTAQQQLTQIGAGAEAELKKAAAESDDPEIRSRAALVLSLLENSAVSQGSLITLHARQMPPQEVFTAISEQTHSHIDAAGMAVSTAVQPGHTVTLDADQKPFWQVMGDICMQLNVCPSLNYNGQNAMRLMPAWENWLAHDPHEIVGPYWIGISSLTHARTANFNGSNPFRDEFSGQLIFLAEPRLVVTQISDFKVIEANDDAGHSLMPRPRPMGAPEAPLRRVQWSIPMLQFGLTYPEQPGTKISLLRGEVLVTLAENFQQYQMDDVLGTPKVTNPLDGTDLQIHVSMHENEIRVDMQCARGTLDADKWSTFESNMSNMTLEDADGHRFAMTHPPSITMASESISASSFKGYATFAGNASAVVHQPATDKIREPKRLVWTFPTSTKAVKVPVTLKDFPMP